MYVQSHICIYLYLYLSLDFCTCTRHPPDLQTSNPSRRSNPNSSSAASQCLGHPGPSLPIPAQYVLMWPAGPSGSPKMMKMWEKKSMFLKPRVAIDQKWSLQSLIQNAHNKWRHIGFPWSWKIPQ